MSSARCCAQLTALPGGVLDERSLDVHLLAAELLDPAVVCCTKCLGFDLIELPPGRRGHRTLAEKSDVTVTCHRCYSHTIVKRIGRSDQCVFLWVFPIATQTR